MDRYQRMPLTLASASTRTDLSRLLDLGLVLLFSPLLVSLAAAAALWIKLDSLKDPILFRQWRTGQNGRRFHMLKFRTMVVDAEERKAELAAQNLLQWPDFKVRNDPRITRPGRFLRRTSLDELPQLWNVIVGDMSLVGPRPTSFDATTYDLWHTERLDTRPGITGLYQVVGRGTIEFDQRARLDISYGRRRTLMSDLMVLLRTLPAAFKGQ
ncbi:MAG: sugar transferase [Geminicoccaceae bacterium]